MVAHVERSQDTTLDDLSGLQLTLRHDYEVHRPDFTVVTFWGVYGFWYGLAPGRAVLEAGNERLHMQPESLQLGGGEIGWFEGTAGTRPSLEVGLVLPLLLREEPLSLEVRTLPDGDLLAEAPLPRRAGRHRFDGLVPELLEVVLDTHVGSFRRRVDLTHEQVGFVTLEPEVIELFGTVYRGGEPHPATVELRTAGGETVEAVSDAEGGYRAISLDPVHWVTVRLEGVDQEPWSDVFMPAIEHSRELDFEISDAEVTVRVLDAVTRQGIAGAFVAVRNVYLPAAEGGGVGDRAEREKVIAESHPTGEDGLAHLPPPRPGRLELHAEADYYRPMVQPLVLDVEDPPRDREVELLLEPFGKRVPVHLRLPDGSPAAGAEVLRVGSLSAGSPLFSGRADSSGVVEVPIAPAQGLLLLKHHAAAFGIVEWESWSREPEVTWTFPSLAPRPLSLRVLEPSGAQPARGVFLSLWVQGRKLSGRYLYWLLDAPLRPDPSGFWVCRRLPGVAVRVLAWYGDAHAQEAAGALDALATDILHPWPERVEVRAVR
jgi:hypothetical protein